MVGEVMVGARTGELTAVEAPESPSFRDMPSNVDARSGLIKLAFLPLDDGRGGYGPAAAGESGVPGSSSGLMALNVTWSISSSSNMSS
jgi:hypothetical protein